ncbi:hypothetical protein AB0B30_27955 [Streptomyces narbonensis]|uniref:MarR family transcriptional regulator n=1 Tax=Streptomyces narbonensis TaxID=67333 RepID=A0ABV3CDW2_9ACTN
MATPTSSNLTAVTRSTVTIAVTETTVHTVTPKMWEALAKLEAHPLDSTAMAWRVGTWGRTSALCSRLVRAGLAEYQTNTCLITEQGRAALSQRPAGRQPTAP